MTTPGDAGSSRSIRIDGADHLALKRAQLHELDQGRSVSIRELIHDLMPYLPGADLPIRANGGNP